MKIKDVIKQHHDGSFELGVNITIQGSNGQVSLGPGVRFSRGVAFMGLDVDSLLEMEIN